MSTRVDSCLTVDEIDKIQRALSHGSRVELIPTEKGVLIYSVKRDKIK